ncbi:hypothetical protein D9M73_122600 [compost metagenome]
MGYQHFGGRQRHADHDEERNNGPGDFNGGGLVEVGGLVALRLAVLPDRIEHHGEYGHEDHETDDHHEPVQPVLLFGNLGDCGVQVELSDSRATR